LPPLHEGETGDQTCQPDDDVRLHRLHRALHSSARAGLGPLGPPAVVTSPASTPRSSHRTSPLRPV